MGLANAGAGLHEIDSFVGVCSVDENHFRAWPGLLWDVLVKSAWHKCDDMI